jgi:hypothetical protein
MNDERLGILDEEGFPVYSIDKNSLGAILQVEGAPCSECILQLAHSSFITTRLLYRIAFLIQKNFPENGIDWFTTFYHVEKTDYLQKAFYLKLLLENEKIEEKDNNAKEMAAFMENELVYDVDTKLLKIVMMNLLSHNVIVR